MATYYERVQEILSDAAMGANPNHGGQGRFWEDTLPEFKVLVIYGQKLIADPGADRGARSALIKALRGDAPFDGSVFNRMPFGLPPVKPPDIQFIQSWIDADLPDTEIPAAGAAPTVGATPGEVAAPGEAPPSGGTPGDGHTAVPLNQTGAVRDATNQPRVRKNINKLPPGELANYKSAIAQIRALPAEDPRSFDHWARIHTIDCMHGTQNFLPWHRAYLIEFEDVLRQFVPSVTIPYWDWINDREIPAAFTGDDTNPLFDARRFPGSIPGTFIPSKGEWDDVQDAPTWPVYGGRQFAAGDNEFKTHNPMHVWTGGDGGDMTRPPTAAYDPIFWSFHCSVDRQWDLWQKLRPGVGPTTELDRILDGLRLLVKDVLTVEQLNYEYASSESLVVLDNTVAHTSVVIPDGSAPESVDVASSVVVGLQPEGAEVVPGAQRPVRGLTTVQFHQVKHPKESYVVHLFVNTPDANVETPRQGNPNYAGRFTIWGHGECFGGKGHCDVPADARAKGIRHHLVPFDFDYDISQCVAKIGAYSEKLDVCLVVEVLCADSDDAAQGGLQCDQVSVVSRI